MAPGGCKHPCWIAGRTGEAIDKHSQLKRTTQEDFTACSSPGFDPNQQARANMLSYKVGMPSSKFDRERTLLAMLKRKTRHAERFGDPTFEAGATGPRQWSTHTPLRQHATVELLTVYKIEACLPAYLGTVPHQPVADRINVGAKGKKIEMVRVGVEPTRPVHS